MSRRHTHTRVKVSVFLPRLSRTPNPVPWTFCLFRGGDWFFDLLFFFALGWRPVPETPSPPGQNPVPLRTAMETAPFPPREKGGRGSALKAVPPRLEFKIKKKRELVFQENEEHVFSKRNNFYNHATLKPKMCDFSFLSHWGGI